MAEKVSMARKGLPAIGNAVAVGLRCVPHNGQTVPWDVERGPQ